MRSSLPGTGRSKSAVERAIEDLKKAMEGSDGAAIQRALDQLTAAQHKAAESLYRSQAEGAGPGGPSSGAGAAGGGAGGPGGASGAGQGQSGDVIDAEVVDEGKQ